MATLEALQSAETPQYADYYTDDDTNIYIEDDSSSSVTDRDLVNNQPQPVIRHSTGTLEHRSSTSKSYCRTVIMILILTVAALAAGLTLPLVLMKDRSITIQSESDGDNGPGVAVLPPSGDEGVDVVSNDGTKSDNDQVNTTEIPPIQESTSTSTPISESTLAPTSVSTSAPASATSALTATPASALTSTPVSEPALEPVSAPTSVPSDSIELAATTAAPSTLLPATAAPSKKTTPSPTQFPSATMAEKVLTTVRESSVVPERLEDASTSEGRAITWMQNTDRLVTSRIVQRYTIATMVYSLNIMPGGGVLEPTVDECSWVGITCDSDVFITAIEWPARNRLGRLPPDIGLLTSLVTLDLAENLIVGEIPNGLYDLEKLQYLYLQNNLLTGTLSSRIGQLSELRKIFLGSNTLTGPLPRELGTPSGSTEARNLDMDLSNLYYLDLGRNYLSGPVPADWVEGGMSSLRTLYLDYNLLTGTLPDELAQIGNGEIQQLVINDNLFTGEVPVENFQTGFLQTFELHNNAFEKMKTDICDLSIFESVDGTMSVFKADCSICECRLFCDNGRCVE